MHAREDMACRCGHAVRLAALALAMTLPPASLGCRSASTGATLEELKHVRWSTGFLRFEFREPVAMDEILLRDAANGRVIQRTPMPVERREHLLPVDETLPERCVAELRLRNRHIAVGIFRQEPERFTASVDVPFGQSRYRLAPVGEQHTVDVFVSPDGDVTLGLLVENHRQSQARFRWLLASDRRVQWQPPPHDRMTLAQADDRQTLTGTGLLCCEFDNACFLPRVGLRAEANMATIDCVLQWHDQTNGVEKEHGITIRLRKATPEQLSRHLDIESIAFPADAQGRRQSELPADSIYLDDPVWSSVRRWLRPGSRLRDPYAPYAYQAVRIRNRSSAALHLAIESEVAATSTSKPLLEFAPPAWKAPRRVPTAEHVLRVPAQAIATARIPLYVAPDVVPGTYVRRFRVYPLGSRTVVARQTMPLHVVRSSGWISVVTLGCFIVCPAAWLLFGMGHQRVARRVGTAGLTSIGLIASLLFLVSYTSGLGSNLLAGLLGPFAVFISGLANEGLTCLLMALVVTLMPVPGSVALASVAIFLINSSISGQLGITELLFVTVSIVLRETFLAVLGITTFWRPGEFRRRPVWLAWRIALALGMANAMTMLVQFCLVQVLYRLFYAPWYVWSVSLVTGLIYGTLGAWLGVRLGIELRRVAQ